MIGPDKILGVSARTVQEALAAESAGADYLGVGSMYATPSKETTVVGVDRLRSIREAVSIPIVAIGGIADEHIDEVIDAGSDGIAVISAIFDSDDVSAKTSQLRSRIDVARPSVISSRVS